MTRHAEQKQGEELLYLGNVGVISELCYIFTILILWFKKKHIFIIPLNGEDGDVDSIIKIEEPRNTEFIMGGITKRLES